METGYTDKLSLRPQIARSVNPSYSVRLIMLRVIGLLRGTEGISEYDRDEWGSSWYVELPAHLNDLYEECGEVAVRDVVYKLLSGDACSDLIWDAIEGKPYLP